MKRFSAQYILTNSGPPLKRSVITVNNDGSIVSVENTNGALRESQSVEFYNGIIIPGFVNCHCHLELSHLKGKIPENRGLADFITNVRNLRDKNEENIVSASISADNEMYSEGVNLCADICNTSVTFEIKKTSRIRYVNLLEVFGIDPEKADHRMEEILRLSEESEKMDLSGFIVPHSIYSVSLPLFRLLKSKTKKNKVTSIHFLESEDEISFLSDIKGPLRNSYKKNGLLPDNLKTPENHLSAILKEVTSNGNLILVHNTFADQQTVRAINKRRRTFWCLCPDSNKYVENKIPPADMLHAEGCDIVIGTDSPASTKKLSILAELKTLQKYFPSISLEELVRWATINGARALCENQNFGRIVPGIKPGLLVLQDVDLDNFKLLPDTTVTRLL